MHNRWLMAKKSLNMIEKMMDPNIIDYYIINCAIPSIITIENRYQIDFGKPAHTRHEKWGYWVSCGTSLPKRLRQLISIERFRFPRWREFWTRDITSSCVIWRHAFKLKFRRWKQTWKQRFWGWPLTCGHDVTFRRSRSGKRLSKPP